ncbi:1-acyl-sn-glycerol-3-phosphate acyltransferase [Microbacterium sp. SORGH_AS_0888]|uniref:lysophospholipid acyltransferase family protein n=1 Tax=Microbacterium sp. SORGH_AS_0888 TaxID=3041791 RepID=UPI00277F71B2|nr:lysophospholipid acyltransferase family protein [Microbacterium sp. SORGH_AS_0888]MDQ1128373.1 1-acyl-sn-glycerol-3-phosphate acyltransferase [Microbacterium sp. SORGH_AS_0888]
MARARRRRVDPEKSGITVFRALAGIVLPLVGLLAKIEIQGEENLPEEGPYVLAPNHYSEFDPLVVCVALWRLGRAPRFMAKESLFRIPVVGWALRVTGMVPVPRAASSVAAKHTLDTARHLVERGAGITVYPEGTLTRDPDMWPMRGKTGAARLAMAGDIPLIPAAHWGVQEIMPRYGKLRLWPLRKRVTFAFGPALVIDEQAREHPNQTTEQSRVTAQLMDEIAELLAGIRNEPAPATRWNPNDHGQRETGRLEPEN